MAKVTVFVHAADADDISSSNIRPALLNIHRVGWNILVKILSYHLNNIMNIKYSIQETTIYTFSDNFNKNSGLNRYDKMRPLFLKSHTGHFSA